MPVSVVVGGQFGSEGKGKVALELARDTQAAAVVRVGGPNSGHTAYDRDGRKHILRSLPTAALLPAPICVIPAGAYIDVDVLLDEIFAVGLAEPRLAIDPNAVVVTPECKAGERASGLRERIGSTLSGTGAAVLGRIQRDGTAILAQCDNRIRKYLRPTRELLRGLLNCNHRIVVEGTQGFGLSLLHSPHYPKVTSRDTTAASFLSETGLSPMDVDDVTLVIRAFPIRVPGDSGPLPGETSWEVVAEEGGHTEPFVEYTSVTKSIRRVARFDAAVVKAAIEANNPTRIVLNHLDYTDAACVNARALTTKSIDYLKGVEDAIGRKVDFVGLGPDSLLEMRHQLLRLRA